MTPLFDVEQIAAAVNSGVRESDLLSRYVHQAGNSPSYVVQWSTTTPPTVQASDPGSPNPIPSEDQGMTAEEMLRSLLGLGEDATPEEMAEAFEAFNAAADPEEEEEVAQLKAKIKTLEAAAAQPTDDSAKALAAQNAKLIGEMEELRTEVATMRSDSEEKEVNASLDAAIASGRLSKDGVKHMKELYTAGGKKVVDLALAALPVGLPQGELGTSGTGNETTENTTVDFEKYRDRVDAGLDEKGARIRMVACAHAAGEFDEDDIRTSAPGFIAAAAKKEG